MFVFFDGSSTSGTTSYVEKLQCFWKKDDYCFVSRMHIQRLRNQFKKNFSTFYIPRVIFVIMSTGMTHMIIFLNNTSVQIKDNYVPYILSRFFFWTTKYCLLQHKLNYVIEDILKFSHIALLYTTCFTTL